ncbi:MAG: hypothetical protein P4L48_23510 [Mycobacterium sp.]|nr:hypothetical protein [Mycobacterium sp.]
MTEPHGRRANAEDDHQEGEWLEPTCEGMADIPGPIDDDQEGGAN